MDRYSLRLESLRFCLPFEIAEALEFLAGPLIDLAHWSIWIAAAIKAITRQEFCQFFLQPRTAIFVLCQVDQILFFARIIRESIEFEALIIAPVELPAFGRDGLDAMLVCREPSLLAGSRRGGVV